MKYVIDIETDSLTNVKNIWLVVIKCIETGEFSFYKNITKDKDERERFLRDCETLRSTDSELIGHNLLGFDWPILRAAGQGSPSMDGISLVDTLILSKLIDYSRKGHSIEDYGIEFGLEKGKFTDFSKYSKEMEDYCVRDVEICHRIYSKYHRYCNNPVHVPSILLEHQFQLVVNSLHDNGFGFNADKANRLLEKVTSELAGLDKEILDAFPARLKLIREINPHLTKFGTLSRTDFRWVAGGDLAEFNGGPFCRCAWVEFNPSSHKQIVTVLSEAGWSPVDKTQTHIDTERAINQLKYKKDKLSLLTLKDNQVKLNELQKSGWKVNETNLETLPAKAPKAARLLARRILLESRRRTLTEWLALAIPDATGHRIHGKFYGIGAWTHRMAHQNPNTANIPNAVRVSDGSKTLLGKELRALWCAPKNRLLVGVDAEAIQLRVFAHLINDPALINAIVNGKKSDGTDPHSLNKSYFGDFCKTRNAAKHSLYAIFFGGKGNKIAEIMGCRKEEAEEAIEALVKKYPGLAHLQKEVFPADAKRGYFIGLDGRKVRIPGDTVSQRQHLCMSGYLQNGEKVIMARATVKFNPKLKDYDSFLVDLVHDEWQAETPNNMEIALKVAKLMADSLPEVGEELSMHCPLAGSYYNDDIKDYTIATNWAYTH